MSELGSELSKEELEEMFAEKELVLRKGFEGVGGLEAECKKEVEFCGDAL